MCSIREIQAQFDRQRCQVSSLTITLSRLRGTQVRFTPIQCHVCGVLAPDLSRTPQTPLGILTPWERPRPVASSRDKIGCRRLISADEAKPNSGGVRFGPPAAGRQSTAEETTSRWGEERTLASTLQTAVGTVKRQVGSHLRARGNSGLPPARS